jgi:hypothetical protein
VRRASVLVVAFALLAAGCGGGHAHDVLSDTASNLGKIRSGDLTLRLVVSPRSGTKGRIGFVLRGPFALRKGRLPVAKIAYTQIAGSHEATATFISTGTQAWAEANGRVRELSAAETAGIRQASAGGPGGLGLDIASWVKDPKVTSDGDLDHVSAHLDVVSAANGLLGLLRNLGKAAPTIEGSEADRLRDAVDSSSFDVWTTKQKRLLRRLVLKAELGLSVPSQLRRVLGEVVGANIDFELAIANANQPVTVTPPS